MKYVVLLPSIIGCDKKWTQISEDGQTSSKVRKAEKSKRRTASKMKALQIVLYCLPLPLGFAFILMPSLCAAQPNKPEKNSGVCMRIDANFSLHPFFLLCMLPVEGKAKPGFFPHAHFVTRVCFLF